MAHVIAVTDKAMLATNRCDRCGAQAWVEVVLNGNQNLLFCATHARINWDALMEHSDYMIADHRPTLVNQESGQRDAASAAN